jgi:hypothetical protein
VEPGINLWHPLSPAHICYYMRSPLTVAFKWEITSLRYTSTMDQQECQETIELKPIQETKTDPFMQCSSHAEQKWPLHMHVHATLFILCRF